MNKAFGIVNTFFFFLSFCYIKQILVFKLNITLGLQCKLQYISILHLKLAGNTPKFFFGQKALFKLCQNSLFEVQSCVVRANEVSHLMALCFEIVKHRAKLLENVRVFKVMQGPVVDVAFSIWILVTLWFQQCNYILS